MLKGWSSARSLTLLAVATLLCLLPFSGKAFHIDDPLFLWSAQQITRHPLDPYGFQLIWDTTLMPMSEVTKNPPLACYYSAMIGAIAGWSERVLHLGFLLPALALVLGTYRLAQRFTQSPLIAAAATLLTPGVLVSASSVMCDTMMLAFWVWAIILWLEGIESAKPGYLLASSFLMAGAALTKYFGICLVPLLFAYSILKQRRLGAWVWYFAVPVLLLAGYQFWTDTLYGHGMFSDALRFAPQRVLGGQHSALFYPLICTSFVGGCTLPALTLAPSVWPRKQVLIAILLEGLAIAIGWLALDPNLHAMRLGVVLQQQWKTAGPELALCIAGGASVLALAAVDVWKQRDADSLLLALWVFGTFAFIAFLNWAINARSVLALIPAAGILLARRLDAQGVVSERRLKKQVALALLVSGMISFWIAQADTEWANSARQAAEILHQRTRKETAVWFQGHWGFQYYMQQSGLHPFDFSKCTLNPGDLLIVPANNIETRDLPPQFVASADLLEIKLRQPVITHRWPMAAGFYGSYFGFLPFAFGAVPPEQYHLFRVGTTVRPEQWQ